MEVEENTSEYKPLSMPLPMDESLELIFSHMISQELFQDAIYFIRSIDINFKPSERVLKTVIFEILMKSDDIQCLALSSDYLDAILNIFPPNTNENRELYYDSIRDNKGLMADLWNLFNLIVNSYFCHCAIYIVDEGNTIKYPSCKFLLEFYVNLFSVDFQSHSAESFNDSLVMKLIWPDLDRRGICMSYRTERILRWVNDMYSCVFANDMGSILEMMHEMLNLMVRCIIESRHNLSDFAAFSSTHLAEIVEQIINFCRNAFETLPNVKLFLSSISLTYLRAKLSERIIRHFIKVYTKRSVVTTLRDIVDQCMFPPKFNKNKNISKPNIYKDKNLRKRVEKKGSAPELKTDDAKQGNPPQRRGSYSAGSQLGYTVKPVYKDTEGRFSDLQCKLILQKSTKLHEYCRRSMFGDLAEALKSPKLDINARDQNGSTPLHEACLSGNRICVQSLIEGAAKAPGEATFVDYTATNNEGQTPLHLAVIKDYEEVVEMLLFNGGAEPLTIADNNGQLPVDLAKSPSLKMLLQEYQITLKNQENQNPEPDSTPHSREAPVFRLFKDYSIYLHSLNCLLSTYCNMFKLIDFIWNHDTPVSSHEEKKCYHYTGKDMCSEDVEFISELPTLIDVFIESICKNAARYEIHHLEPELIPLRAFKASLSDNSEKLFFVD